MLKLRPYQDEALNALFAYWREEPGSPLIELPTGAGKSLVMATIMKELLEGWPDMRVGCVTHVRELIAQNYEELCGIWPWAPAGIYSAGLKRRDTQSQILFMGIQSVFNKAHRIGHLDVLMVDECHLMPPKSETSYGTFVAGLRAINPEMKLLGLTATPYRLDAGRLDEPAAKTGVQLFDQIVYSIGIGDLIEQGYLSPLRSKATATALDVSGVHRRGGEFIASELEAAVNRDDVTQAAVDEILSYGRDRRCWLVFCAGVDHAYAVRDELRSRGIVAATVEGGMAKGDRDRVIADFKAGRIRALTNANILTTGFNVPQVDLLAMLRPTESTALYVQMVGRGSRNAPGKGDCLVLDFARNIARHGPVDDVRPRRPGEGGGEAPVKICPECQEIVHASARVCPHCDAPFPIEEAPRHQATADVAPILSKDAPAWVSVSGRSMHRHEKVGGGVPTVRIEFRCGLVSHRKWICPEHEGRARGEFEKFWIEHAGDNPIPSTVDEAIERADELLGTREICIRPAGRYFDVLDYKPAQHSEAAA